MNMKKILFFVSNIIKNQGNSISNDSNGLNLKPNLKKHVKKQA